MLKTSEFSNLPTLNSKSNKMNPYQNRVEALRAEMKKLNIDAYLIPSSDPHISEYLPEKYKVISWLSGFTGSAGTLLITQDFAGLWTDSRYFVQANQQLEGSGIQLMKLQVQHAPEFVDWLSKKLQVGQTLAYDGKLVSGMLAQVINASLKSFGIEINSKLDLLDQIWEDRPSLPAEPAYLLSEKETGEASSKKIEKIREKMKEARVDYHVISTLDDLAWILNIRGTDVHCNPVVLGFLLISLEDAMLFIDESKLNKMDLDFLNREGILIKPYEQIWSQINELPSNSSLWIDPKRNCEALYAQVPATIKRVEKQNPSTDLKALKNPVEMEKTRETMIKDGVALTKFFKWLEEQMSQSVTLSEQSISDRIRAFRAEQDGFVGESFDTIAGFQANGALPHYKITPESNRTLEKRGLLLIDSGGQYRGGTTDITRVISLGEITAQEKQDYTLVLKGMIEGSTTIFPTNTRGYQIDAMTRRPIWDALRNYGHGTGHGVGFFLNVHEGPQVFNAAAVDVSIKEGMITSIEPGIYREGEYGIRIENLVLSKAYEQNYFGEFMHFETLTLCYIDTDLIDTEYLDKKHIDWLNEYHAMVYDRLHPYLSVEEQNWLKAKTAKI
jgi:Xaa-Pro aminopeptidase